MRKSHYYAFYCLRVLLLVAVSLPVYQGTARAAASTDARLNITSSVCVVDVVNNGSGQILNASSSCAVVLPNLLTDVPGITQRPVLPFAGPSAAGQVAVQSDIATTTQEGPLSSEREAGIINQPAMRMVAMVTGISATLIVTIIGIDIALFELRLTKFLMQGLSARNPIRLLKR